MWTSIGWLFLGSLTIFIGHYSIIDLHVINYIHLSDDELQLRIYQ